ncbi:M15 family metallopeptidase [Burkholderiaceae bacterium UC74_6]
MTDVYLQRIAATRARLGITDDLLAGRELAVQEEAVELETVQRDPDGREYQLTPQAAQAWRAMQAAAAGQGVVLHLVSAFRSLNYQVELIERQLRLGRPIAEILRGSACPGYSEHHTGRAVDIDTPDNPGLGEDFERTTAFEWLGREAANFGFSMSFPRGNAAGYMYEPWHWLFAAVRGCQEFGFVKM